MYYYQPRSNPFAYRKPVNKKIPVKVTVITADQVWAAAALADRVNGGHYFKEPQYQDQQVTHEPNRTVMLAALNEQYEPTAEDLELGRLARQFHKSNLLMAALKAPLKEFEQAVATAAAKDEFALEVDRYDMAIIASQICAYRSKFKEQEMQFGLDRTPLADVGTKVICDITVAKCVYSQNYDIFYVSAVATKENKMIRFTQSSKMLPGVSLKIKGKVKGYTDGTTVLHYVKAA